MAFELISPAFPDGGVIPFRCTADGPDVSPPLSWAGVPERTRELVLMVDDTDAPGREPWVHWLVYKMPASTPGLPEGIPRAATLQEPAGALQGRNSWGRLGYGGPSPSRGSGVHRYRFGLFVLGAALDVFHSLSKQALWKAMHAQVIGSAELIGTYRR